MSSTVTVLPTTLGSSKINSSAVASPPEFRWIQLRNLDWTDQTGRVRKWEMAERKTTGSGGVDAAAIVGLLKHPSKPLSIPIILQYRPPIDAICVELPAGLIDGDETAGSSGVRELEEETGYAGEVVYTGQVVYSDPGMSKANMRLVTIECDLKEGEAPPVANLEDGEFIEVRVTPLAQLFEHLEAYDKLGYKVDARLYHFAAGINTAQKYLGI